MNKIILILLISFSFIIPVVADDDIYIISENKLIKQDSFKFVASENIKSSLTLDNDSIYFYTSKFLYGLNKSTGQAKYKIMLKNTSDIKITDNYIYANSNNMIIKINKSTGIIESKKEYINNINSIYSLFGLVSGGSGTINNYYTNNYYNNTTSDNTKINKSGDNITGLLRTNVTTNYTGAGYTIFEAGRTSTPFKIRYTLNDVNGAFNMRMNIQDDLTSDFKTGESTGFSFGLRPAKDDFIISRCRYNSTGFLVGSCDILFAVAGVNSTGDSGYSSNMTAIPYGNFQVRSLAGSGNRPICADPNGKFVIC